MGNKKQKKNRKMGSKYTENRLEKHDTNKWSKNYERKERPVYRYVGSKVDKKELYGINWSKDQICPICNKEVETLEHLYL